MLIDMVVYGGKLNGRVHSWSSGIIFGCIVLLQTIVSELVGTSEKPILLSYRLTASDSHSDSGR